MCWYSLWSVFVFLLFCDGIHAQKSCEKINFDRTDLAGIIRCPQISEMFTKKEYSNSRVIKPFKEGAQRYLSNRVSDLSCGETESDFVLDEHSLIQITNFLLLDGSSTLVVRVIDLDGLNGQREVVHEWSLSENVGEWRILDRFVGKRIERAKIQIESKISALSTFAFEHLYITNELIETDECRKEEWLPSTSTTPEITSTTAPSTTSPLTSTPSTQTPSTTTPSLSTSTVQSTSTEIQTSSSSSSFISTSSSTSLELTSSSSSISISSTTTPSMSTTEEQSTSSEIGTSSSTSSSSTELEPSTVESTSQSTTAAPTTINPPVDDKAGSTISYLLLIIISAISLAIVIIGCILISYLHRKRKYIVTPRDSTTTLHQHQNNTNKNRKEIIPTAQLQYQSTNNGEGVVDVGGSSSSNTVAPIGTVLITGENSNPYNNQNNLRIAAWMLEMDKKNHELENPDVRVCIN